MSPNTFKRLKLGILAGLIWLGSGPGVGVAIGDVLELHDGTLIEGRLRVVEGGYEVTLPDGSVRRVASGEVKRVSVDGPGRVTERSATEGLASLRRSVEAEKTIERIVERYQQFIQTNGQTEVVEEAKRDLAVWMNRLENGYVRLGRLWMTPEERIERVRGQLAAVEELRSIMNGPQPQVGRAIIERELQTDPGNVSFVYLDGVLKLAAGDAGAARRAFDTVLQSVPDHAPSLNNVAAAHMLLGREQAAIAPMERAMRAAPDVQVIIDNAMEVLHAHGRAPARGTPADRLLKQWEQQEQTLARAMQQRGLFRWGSSWVTQARLEELQAKEREYQAKVQELNDSVATARTRIQQMQDTIKSNETTIKKIEADAIFRDIDGRIIRRPLPDVYYELQRDNERLKLEISREQQRVQQVDREIEAAKAILPVPPFMKRLTPIGADGVPVVLPDGVDPATVMPASMNPPATAPNPDGAVNPAQGTTPEPANVPEPATEPKKDPSTETPAAPAQETPTSPSGGVFQE